MPEHRVQFYDSEDFLVRQVADYVAGGLEAGAPVLVIARASRLAAFDAALAAGGRDVGAAVQRGQLVLLDAHETLARMLVDGMPDERAFFDALVPAMERLAGTASQARPRAYGEIVDVLWSEGRAEAALQLERYWNALGAKRPFSMLCAYRIDPFRGDRGRAAFEHVCAVHDEVALPEAADADLQQRRRADAPRVGAALAERGSASAGLRDAARVRTVVVLRAADSAPLAIANGDVPARARLRLTEVGTATEALPLLESGRADLCVCVATGAESAALDLLYRARDAGLRQPFVGVVDSENDDELAATLIDAGYEDVIERDSLDAASLRRIARNARLRGGRARRLLEAGRIDELTGVLNRRGFLERLEAERLRCATQQRTLSVLYLDLDDFKHINDRYGHRTGDEALRAFVAELQPLLRRADAIGRLGGDEFAVALPGVSPCATAQIVRRLHARLRGAPLATVDGAVAMRVSVGIHATHEPASATTASILEEADAAMYRAKHRRKSDAAPATPSHNCPFGEIPAACVAAAAEGDAVPSFSPRRAH